MPKKIDPKTFDAWLGKVIQDEADPKGGRPAIAMWIGASEQSVNRRSRGEVGYLAREVAIIAEKVGVPVAELVSRALKRYGGIDKLMTDYEVKSEPVANIADYRKPDLATVPEEELTRERYAAGRDKELEQDEQYDD